MRYAKLFEPLETIEPAPPLSHAIKGRNALWTKFESRDEWLEIRSLK